MKRISVSDLLGNVKTKNIGFSWLYFFFGPFYSLVRGRIASSLGLLLLYFYCLPIPGMDFIVYLTHKIPLPTNAYATIDSYFLYFRKGWDQPYNYMGILIIIVVHLLFSFIIEGLIIKKTIRKKKLYPCTELDARILIRHFAVKEDVELYSDKAVTSLRNYKNAEEIWGEMNKSQTSMFETNALSKTNGPMKKSLKDNAQSLEFEKTKKELEYYQNLYKLGKISKDELALTQHNILSGKKD